MSQASWVGGLSLLLLLLLLSESPRSLLTVVHTVLRCLVVIFRKCALDINWAKGKTEAFIKLRGRNAASFYQSLRVNGSLSIEIPESNGERLHVVDVYKHLGFVCCSDGSLVADANSKVASFSNSYAPLATRIFVANCIPDSLKSLFQASLLETKLLFNAHVVVPTPAYICTLSCAYMKVVRRRAGLMRYDRASAVMSDCDVRCFFAVVSIDCLLMRARLRYLRRLLVFAPPPLRAALHLKVKGEHLPWVSLVLSDLVHLRSVCNLPIPPPTESLFASRAWSDLIVNQPHEWHRMVSEITFYHSVADKGKALPQRIGDIHCDTSLSFVCTLCSNKFPTNMQLGGHLRMVHGIRSNLRLFVPDSSCPVCLTFFSSRLSCLRHLSDSRRPKCRDLLLNGSFPQISAEECLRLDNIDRILKTQAKRQGHSHVLSTRPAVTSSGRLRGLCSRAVP